MEEKITKAKIGQKILLISGFSFFMIIFIYVTYFLKYDIEMKITNTLFFIATIASVIRYYYADKLRRYRTKYEIVDFWLFYIKGFQQKLSTKDNFRYFLIIPFFKKQPEIHLEKIRIKVNYLTIIFYIAIIGFFILLWK